MKHLTGQHSTSKLVAKDPVSLSVEDAHHQPTPPKQAKNFQHLALGAQKVTQKEINKLVAGYTWNPILKERLSPWIMLQPYSHLFFLNHYNDSYNMLVLFSGIGPHLV